MDTDDEEMRDASPSPSSSSSPSHSMGEGGFQEHEAEAEGVMTLEVTWFQVDLDYEFDAPRWFDLAREEAPMEAAAAQQWFAAAPDYPPSPLIALMLANDLGLQGLRSAQEAADATRCTTTSHDCPTATEHRSHRVEGRGPCNRALENEQKPAIRKTVRGASSRSSTLMKPTASQLARQRQVEAKNAMLSKISVGARSERTTMCSNDCTYQPAKRQRIENGHVNKVAVAHQPVFIHKKHEKVAATHHPLVMTKNLEKSAVNCPPTGLPKLKITVPREPEFATKLRAERSRILRTMPTNTKQINQQHATSATTTQVAPTRKVVNPVRATDHQQTSRQPDAVGSNVPACTFDRARHLNPNVDKTTEDCKGDPFKFKARPVDRKILASKGDVGAFRGVKKNITVPKEFNLSTGRKGNPAPLTELFTKLSLTTGGHRGIGGQTTGLPNYITSKDCKENIVTGNMQRWL